MAFDQIPAWEFKNDAFERCLFYYPAENAMGVEEAVVISRKLGTMNVSFQGSGSRCVATKVINNRSILWFRNRKNTHVSTQGCAECSSYTLERSPDDAKSRPNDFGDVTK